MLSYKNIADLLIDNSAGSKVANTDLIALQSEIPCQEARFPFLKMQEAKKDAKNQRTVMSYKNIADLLIDNNAGNKVANMI